MKKHGLKVLGLCLMGGLSLMAFSAVAAQAATPEWKILSTTLAGTRSISGSAKTQFLLETKVGKTATTMTIHCTTLNIDDGLIYGSEFATGKKGTGLGTLLFTGCTTLLNGVLSAVCKPVEPIATKVKNLLILHNSDTYILSEPEEGTSFTTLGFGTGECSVPTTPITGSFVSECLTEAGVHEDCDLEKVSPSISTAPATLFESDKLSFGANAMTLKGTASLKLIGTDEGCTWSAI